MASLTQQAGASPGVERDEPVFHIFGDPTQSKFNPVSSTDKLRDQQAVQRNEVQQMQTSLSNQLRQATQNLLGQSPFGQSAAGEAALQRISEAEQRVSEAGRLQFGSPGEAFIKQQGAAAGAAFDPLIQQAKEAKRRGLPKAVIEAGERGGFLSTQFAGVAALQPTAGETFIGAGGELENVRKDYDLVISNYENQKLQAIQAAEMAARKALQTNAKEDLQMAQDAFDRAQSIQKEQQDFQTKQIGLITSLQEMEEDRITFQQMQQDRTMEGLSYQLGTEVENLPPEAAMELVERQAQIFGLDPNRLARAVNIANEQRAQDALNITTKRYNIAKQIPEGETYADPETGMIILGTKEVEPETMEVVQTVGGNEYKVRYDLTDPNNPQEMFRINLGPRWKGGGGSSSGATTNTTLDEAMAQTVNVLDQMKQAGQFNDFTYNTAIQALYNEYDQIPEDITLLESHINQQLEALERGRIGQAAAPGAGATSQLLTAAPFRDQTTDQRYILDEARQPTTTQKRTTPLKFATNLQ